MRRPFALAAAILAVLVLLSAPASGAEDVAAKLKSARSRANAAAGRLAAAESKLAVAEDRANSLKAQAAEAEAHLAQSKTKVRALALQQYVSGRSPLADGADFNALARGATFLTMATSGGRDDVEAYRVARADLEAARARLGQQLDSQRSALSGLRKQRAAIQSELANLAKLQKDLEARAARSRAARSRAARSSSAGSSSAGGATGVIASGSWICPVQGSRAFTNDWGQPRSGGRRHQGTDILSPRNTPIVASVGGTVKGHSSSLGGLSYYLSGDDGTTYFGTHLERLGSTGRVAAGTVIGYVGNSGNARGGPTHLHFEIHPGGGGPVNPYPTLRAHC